MSTTFISSSVTITGSAGTKYFNASAVTSTGDIYIQGNGSDLNIYVFDSNGTLKTTITGIGNIYDSACYDSSNNNVYLAGVNRFGVVNASNNAFVSYSSPWLNGVAFSMVDGFVYATTNNGYIIQKINRSNGSQTNIFTASNGNIISDAYGTFGGCAFDSNNYLYCTTRGVGYVYKFNTSGEIMQLFSTINPLSTYGNLWGFTCDTNTNTLYASSIGTPGAIYKISSSGVSSFYANTVYSSYTVSYDAKNNRLIATDQESTGRTSKIYFISTGNLRLNINNSNLLYYYPLDTDLLNYASGTGVNDATYTINITTSASILNSGSLDLNGTTNMFKLPGHSYQAGGITICMWMKSKTLTPNWYHLFDFGNGQGVDNILFGFTGSDVGNLKGYYHMFNGGSEVFRSYLSYGITDLNWHHYCVTIAPNGAWTVYIDGINQNVNNVGYPSTVTRATCYIGNSFWEDPHMVAYINQILVFNRTLTTGEVSFLANSPSGIEFSSLQSQLINESYATIPSSLSYGSPFQIVYYSSGLVLNSTYSLKNGTTTVDTQTSTGTTITFNVDIPGTYSATLQIYDASGTAFGSPMNFTFTYPCFLQGSKILRLNVYEDEEEYVPVESLKPGDIIKTATCGYKSIAFIGKATLPRPCDDPNKKNRLYVFNKNKCPGVFKDLCITGEHCTLHKSLTPEKQQQVREYMGDNYITESFHRVPACLDERAEPFTSANGTNGPVTIWHFALEHNNLYNNYAVYANGLLVETCSIDFLLNKSSMKLV